MINWSHIHRPTYDYGDGRIITYRSNWELNYSFYLEWLVKNKEIASWEYEPLPRYDFIAYDFSDKEKKRPRVVGPGYLPDFKVNKNDGTFYLVEVKGRTQGIRKIQRMRKYHPDVRVELVDTAAYNTLKRQVGKLLNWI